MVRQLLEKLRAAGFTVTSNGLELTIVGPVEQMTPELRRQITANRDSLMVLVVDAMPERNELFKRCKSACTGTSVDPSELCQWLIDQGDPGWCVLKAVNWWAQRINQRGFPQDGSSPRRPCDGSGEATWPKARSSAAVRSRESMTHGAAPKNLPIDVHAPDAVEISAPTQAPSSSTKGESK